MFTEMIELLAQAATVGAAVFAGWAAWEARSAAKASRAAVESQVVYSAMTDYFQPGMAEALRALRTWVEKHGDDFATVWLEEFKQRKSEAVKVDGARRQVKKVLYCSASVGTMRLLCPAHHEDRVAERVQ